MNQSGGYINTSHISKLIERLSSKYNQTPEIKRAINNSIENTGHGCIFLGTAAGYEGGDKNIRMLVGIHYIDSTLKIGTFGGKCNKGEITIDTIIRETIEEIFNFKPTSKTIEEIKRFLNDNTELYFIFNLSDTHKAYSYIFDLSILADFIRIISSIGKSENIVYFIPTNNTLTNIEHYYIGNIKYEDLSSYNDTAISGTGSTIKLSDFLKERFVRPPSRNIIGLDEIRYLSFPALQHLVDNANTGMYNIFIFGTEKREKLPMRDILIKLLNNVIIKEILT
jgi:hypothetical protein